MQVGMHKRVGAMRMCIGAGMVCYAGIRCTMQCVLCRTGRQDGVRMQGMRYANMRYVIKDTNSTKIKANWGKNGAKRAENRGIVDILYEGFRKCFVNCKFTFYNILSSYYKKLKISKTRKNSSKM